MELFKTYYRWLVGLAVGALAGFLYWRFIGCSSGTCAITSNPYNSMLWFGIMGLLLVPSPKKKSKPEETK